MSGDNMAGRELYVISQKFSVSHEIYNIVNHNG